MSDTLQKLRPDRDLQCYFERPSAVAAISEASENGFTVSGSWRQQFDWAVIEWNRDNVFEHPLFRNLPDGDLSGLTLTYEETRENCIPIDSDLYPTVDWPFLRVWAWDGIQESFYKIRLKDYAVPVEGSYTPAWAEFELQGDPAAGDYVSIASMGEHHTYQLYGSDTIESVVTAIHDSVNAFSPVLVATKSGTRIRLHYTGAGKDLEASTTGANGNRQGAYTFVAGAQSESWSPVWQKFSGGTSPTKWRVTLDFGDLTDIEGRKVPTGAVRKMRWTYAADLQEGAFERGEFRVRLSSWAVTGTGRTYSITSPASVRVDNGAKSLRYSGTWAHAPGNFSGGTIHHTTAPSANVECSYHCSKPHRLYLGTRLAASGATISVVIDGGAPIMRSLLVPGEDTLIRLPLGELAAGDHTVRVTHQDEAGRSFYFDFIEAAVPRRELPEVARNNWLTLATDWDTDHSLALAPERTAWMIHSLGFHGRANHYAGAQWFYELLRPGHQYAAGTVTFSGAPEVNQITRIVIGRTDYPPEHSTTIEHLNLVGDTAESVAKAYELVINSGYTAIRAEAEGAMLHIFSRSMGTDGNKITLAASPSSFAQASGATLSGGLDGAWRTDLTALPRLNRAARDWSRSYFAALKRYGIDVTAAFSMELQHGDPSTEAGIAQRYPGGDPVQLSTPALQTNFSPASVEFWKEVYAGMAAVQAEAGVPPYLQFGEVQWWYFPDATGMPFYDAHTRSTFLAEHGWEMRAIPANNSDPALFAEEVAFLPRLVGEFTSSIMSHVRTSLANCRFEVLYPPDVNETALNGLVNYPTAFWTPATLDCLKTESFTYTYLRNLDLSRASIEQSRTKGFPNPRRSHLVGIGDSSTAWLKEARLAHGEVEVVVLFALDQFCLVGYPVSLRRGLRRAAFLG